MCPFVSAQSIWINHFVGCRLIRRMDFNFNATRLELDDLAYRYSITAISKDEEVIKP